MIAKVPFLVIFILFLAACQPNGKTINATSEVLHQPTLTATVLRLNTAVLPTPTPTTTSTPIPTLPPPEPTTTPHPTPTSTPELMLPTASLIFVSENNLQQWNPNTGEVSTLAKNIPNYMVYSGDTVVFQRDVIPDQEKALVVFHIPTQSEIELLKTSAIPTDGNFVYDVSISPNGRWLAYAAGESRDSVVLTVHEMTSDNQQFVVSDPVLTVTPGLGWNWPHDQMMWATGNEISWSDESGIWVADLNSDPIEPVVAIAPSTNTFLFTSPNPADWDKEPSEVYTTFIPFQWSPNGRYLLAEEYFYEYGELGVIERGTNRLIEIPESAIGPVSDGAIWLDESILLHYQASGTLKVWRIDSENDPMISLQKTIPAVMTGYEEGIWTFGNHLRIYGYSSVFDINLETGELVELVQNIGWPLYWSPDGQYVLWNKTNYIENERFDYMFWDNLNGDTPIELDSILGQHTCCWHWFEE